MPDKIDLEIIEFLSKPENFRTAFHVHVAFPEVLQSLRFKFWQDVEKYLNNTLKDDYTDWTCHFNDRSPDVILLIPGKDGSKLLRIGAGQVPGDPLYYGVMRPSDFPSKSIKELTLEGLLQAKGFGKGDRYYLRYKYFADVSLRDLEVLAKISEGDTIIQQSLANSLIELITDLGTEILEANRVMIEQA